MHQNNHHLPVSEHISHNMFDMLVFLVVLYASTKIKCILVLATVSDTVS